MYQFEKSLLNDPTPLTYFKSNGDLKENFESYLKQLYVDNDLDKYEISLFDVEDPNHKKDINRLEELFLKYDYYFSFCKALFTNGILSIGHYIIVPDDKLSIENSYNYV